MKRVARNLLFSMATAFAVLDFDGGFALSVTADGGAADAKVFADEFDPGDFLGAPERRVDGTVAVGRFGREFLLTPPQRERHVRFVARATMGVKRNERPLFFLHLMELVLN